MGEMSFFCLFASRHNARERHPRLCAVVHKPDGFNAGSWVRTNNRGETAMKRDKRDEKYARQKDKAGARGKGKSVQKQPGGESLLTQPVQLNNPYPGHESKERADEQMMMPHERDETTRRDATGKGNENRMSQDVIEQAKEDTEHGLKDTDLRGIPSDIIASGMPAPGSPGTPAKGTAEKVREKKR